MKRAALALALLAGCGGRVESIGSSPTGRGGSSGFTGDGGKAGNVAQGGATGMGGANGGETGFGGGGPYGCAKQLASGFNHLCIRYDDGRVACMGEGTVGQLGSYNPSLVRPVYCDGVVKATELAAGGDHTCALVGDADLRCWGSNASGEIGTATRFASQALPIAVPMPESISKLSQLALGDRLSCGLDVSGNVACWGTVGYAKFPEPTLLNVSAKAGTRFVAVGADLLRLGDDTLLFDVQFKQPLPATSVVRGTGVGVVQNAIASGLECLLKQSGTVWCRGAGFANFFGPVTALGSDVVEIKVGKDFLCGRTDPGEVRCTGTSERGQLGALPLPKTGHGPAVAIPIAIGARELSLGATHACARMSDGSVRCWGELFGSAFGNRPTAVSTPAATCLVTTEDPPLSRRKPEPAAADELADAVLARIHEFCRGSSDVEACILAGDTLKRGCLQAVALDDPWSRCAAERYWQSAECLSELSGELLVDSSCPLDLRTCGSTPKVVEFCQASSQSCGVTSTRLPESTSAANFCDGVEDCSNAFDELNCSRNAPEFVCPDAQLLKISQLADGREDCAGGADEAR